MSAKQGKKTEKWFSDFIRMSGLDIDYKDDFYDFLINGVPVEVKSCQMTIKAWIRINGEKKVRYRIGRFDFTKSENREKLKEIGGWIALVVRHHKQFILYGFVHSSNLNGERYVSIHKARTLKPLTFAEWQNKAVFK